MRTSAAESEMATWHLKHIPQYAPPCSAFGTVSCISHIPLFYPQSLSTIADGCYDPDSGRGFRHALDFEEECAIQGPAIAPGR